MCVICRDLDHLTSEEAMRNIGEMLIGSSIEQSKHLLDLASKILDKDVPTVDSDSSMDETWEREHRE
jgi:hypothetical protein